MIGIRLVVKDSNSEHIGRVVRSSQNPKRTELRFFCDSLAIGGYWTLRISWGLSSEKAGMATANISPPFVSI